MLTVAGPNAAGKSTLLRLITRAIRPSGGSISVFGNDIAHMPLRQIAKTISFVPQIHKPMFPFTVFEMVLAGRNPHLGELKQPGKADEDKALAAVALTGISDIAGRPYTKISGGQLQLVLIARAIAQEAPVMLLDEPSSHLDIRNQIGILKTIDRIRDEHELCIISVLHDINLSLAFSDRLIFLKNGKKTAEGNPGDIVTAEMVKEVYGVETAVLKDGENTYVAPHLKNNEKK